MQKHYSRYLSVVFFCSAGWIYSGSATGADGVEVEGAPASKVSVAAAEPAPEPAPQQPLTASEANAGKAPTTQPIGMFGPSQSDKSADKAQEKLPDGQTVSVGSFGQIDLHVKDLELTQVLQLLSIQSQRNIVATKNVAGSVSADLYGVDFYEALDAILHTNGFGYREQGNFIYVYTAAELSAQKQAERKTSSRIIKLNYLTASDAAKYVQPLLSASGTIVASGDATTGFQPSLTDGGANSNAFGDRLIVKDFPENIDEVNAVIKELDVRPKQVMVEASILQARLNEDNAFGVDLTILADFAMDEFTSPLSVIDNLLTGTGPGPSGGGGQTSVGQTNSGQSGVRVGIVSNNIAAFIKALDQVTDTTVLANPKMLVLNRQKGDLLVGEKLGYQSTTTTDTSATQTVQFLDVGTKLTVRPFISDDGFIRMELKPSISDGETRTVGQTVIPNETTQELTTNVMVRNGQTVVLGGLFKEDTTISRRQVPYLGDVPVLGLAFKGQDDTVRRAEVIFLVTPTILKDEALYAAGDRAKETVEMARQGAKTGLLPWSRSKLVAGHIRDAMKYQKEGNRAKADWEVEKALSLEPRNMEALRMKEELTGQRIYFPDSQMMQESINRVIKDTVDASPAPASSEAPAAQPKHEASAKISKPTRTQAVQAAAPVEATPAETEEAVATPVAAEAPAAVEAQPEAAAQNPEPVTPAATEEPAAAVEPEATAEPTAAKAPEGEFAAPSVNDDQNAEPAVEPTVEAPTHDDAK